MLSGYKRTKAEWLWNLSLCKVLEMNIYCKTEWTFSENLNHFCRQWYKRPNRINFQTQLTSSLLITSLNSLLILWAAMFAILTLQWTYEFQTDVSIIWVRDFILNPLIHFICRVGFLIIKIIQGCEYWKLDKMWNERTDFYIWMKTNSLVFSNKKQNFLYFHEREIYQNKKQK